MEMTGTRDIPTAADAVWHALNDPAVLKECIAGCESIEADGENSYKMVLAAKVGPVAARFAGKMRLADIDAPRSYTLHFDGSGGVAGFVKGEGRVRLVSVAPDATRLEYTAKAQVGGKLAQVGSRLVDGVAQKLAEDFFTRFVALVTPAPAVDAPAVDTPAVVVQDVATPVPARSRATVYAVVAGVVALFAIVWWWRGVAR